MFIEIDEWRNDNAGAAEILAQPETGRLLSNFKQSTEDTQEKDIP